MTSDREFDLACAAALIAPGYEIAAAMQQTVLHIMEQQLKQARHEKQRAEANAEHYRLRAEYAEKRLRALTTTDPL